MSSEDYIATQTVFIPHWVVTAARRAGLPNEAFMELDKLEGLTSTDDLATMIHLNRAMEVILGDPSLGNTLENSWKTQSFFTHRVEPALFLTTRSVEDRLFDARRLDAERYPQPFEFIDVTKNIIGVVIYPGYFSGDMGLESINLLTSSLLHVFHERDGMELLARRELFSRRVAII